MIINLTSVEESQKAEQIQKIIKSIFPNYTVTVIPSKYATEKGKAQVKAYQKEYNRKNRDMINRKRRERYKRKKEEMKANEKEEMKKYQKEYYEKNRDKLNKKRRENYKKNKLKKAKQQFKEKSKKTSKSKNLER